MSISNNFSFFFLTLDVNDAGKEKVKDDLKFKYKQIKKDCFYQTGNHNTTVHVNIPSDFS